jgi:hypothetical protein
MNQLKSNDGLRLLQQNCPHYELVSSIYGFWLPLWYLQPVLMISVLVTFSFQGIQVWMSCFMRKEAHLLTLDTVMLLYLTM